MQNIAEIEISYSPKLKTNELVAISSSHDAYEILSAEWKDLRRIESFKILLLNQTNKVLGISTVSVGGISGTVADPRLIFQAALKANASSIVLAHNHPSGNLKPSNMDEKLTNKIIKGGNLMDILVIDHLILTDTGFYSFADDGKM